MQVSDREKKDRLPPNIREILLYPQMNVNLVSEISRLELAKAFSKEAKKRYGARIDEIILYGSVARGEDGKDSDIDLLVITRERIPHIQRDISGMAFDSGFETHEKLSAQAYSRPYIEEHKELTFFQNIMEEGMRIG
ncbi:MAG: nucleotidyltransferase domain-containing protein [Thermoplasmatota archaeon]